MTNHQLIVYESPPPPPGFLRLISSQRTEGGKKAKMSGSFFLICLAICLLSVFLHRLSTTAKLSTWNLKKYRSRYEGPSMSMASAKTKPYACPSCYMFAISVF